MVTPNAGKRLTNVMFEAKRWGSVQSARLDQFRHGRWWSVRVGEKRFAVSYQDLPTGGFGTPLNLKEAIYTRSHKGVVFGPQVSG